ncbi:MAG: GTPase Era [Pseudomonadota bacterium]
MSEEASTKFGFVAVMGEPNAGKSTLLNAIIGEKVSIVSSKVQTTRTRVNGIWLKDDTQIAFVDTPGLFSPNKKNTLEKAIVSAAWEGLDYADEILFLFDATRKLNPQTIEILEALKNKTNINLILVLNKIDKLSHEKLLKITQELNDLYDFKATFMISALKNNGLEEMLDYLQSLMPQGPWHYPEDEITDMPMRLMAAEITREKLFEKLYQELPYGLTVETDEWEKFDNGSIKIHQTIYVEREAHKKIILGKGGEMLKKVGIQSRQEIKKLMDTDIHLKLFVKVHDRWMQDEERFSLWNLQLQK